MPEVRPGLFWSQMPGCTPGQEQPGGPKKCHYCGGTHAILVPYEKLSKFMDLWSGARGPLFPVDCMMTRRDFKNFCLQWSLFHKVTAEQDPSKTAIPKHAQDVKQWHVSLQRPAA